jgi:hypothetical protein
MFSQILIEFRNSKTPLSLGGLSRRLDVEKSALEGMLETLVRKGRLKASHGPLAEPVVECESVTCAGCGSAASCPFAGNMPVVTYSLIEE